MLCFIKFINFAIDTCYLSDSAKVEIIRLICNKLHKCNMLTSKKLLLKMNSLKLQENLNKYTHIESCPIRNVLSRFSGKWALLVLCVLSDSGGARFSVIGKAIPDISPKVLTETLRNLEECGLLSRKIYPEVPPKVEYSLTRLGKSLMPVLSQLISWAVDNYDAITGNSSAR